MQSSRRVQAQESLGIANVQQVRQDQTAIEQEIKRKEAKINKKIAIEQSQSYRQLKRIATIMDKYFLDPLLGFIPGIGDIATPIISVPFVYVSLFKVKSISLTLAVIYNSLRDMLLGMIPFFIGDFIDVLHRCHLQNLKLIVGFVEDDKEIIKEVNQKAIKSAIGIVILIGLIYLMFKMVASIVSWFSGLFG
ncbi:MULTISPECIES: DUF4112 domain-containing protein [Myroides]|uniref:DUF4112 domain-containing protein n=1 Tax=Myroides TaxID=76831 RepID=UPI001303CD20|nr:DUF4112 domain-containing protein [Myroides phaeus]